MENYKVNAKTKELIKALLSFQDAQELGAFLRDLCTLEEIQEMSERWAIARMLSQKISYREIANKLKVSTTTVSRVAFWLSNGTGGYKIALKNIHHNSSIRRKS